MKTWTWIGVVLGASQVCGQLSFVDVTAEVGLDGLHHAHGCFVDLNNDHRPDLVIERNKVFLNVVDDREESTRGFRFVRVENAGLPDFRTGDIAVFADLNNDGNKDCLYTRYLDINNDKYEPPADGPAKTAWLAGNGDGTFGSPLGSWQIIDQAGQATTAAVAVGDVDSDGLLDVYLGNWYINYGDDLEGFRNQLLIAHDGSYIDAGDAFANHDAHFDEDNDAAGRPTYGVMILHLPKVDPLATDPVLLDLNYGRRWNRLWMLDNAPGQDTLQPLWRDHAPAMKLDGDAIGHGRYPAWLKERARTDPRFDREDEKPFRSNGNTFDATLGDIDNDGDFDLFFAEIAHAWAGESSDRSRFLLQQQEVRDQAEPWVYSTHFGSPTRLGVDRIPTDPTIHSWNQGDIYAQLADFDLDGRLDLLLCSSDYPDNQRLRIYRQQRDGSFVDITSWVGIDHIGAGQPSLADVDGDGDLDIFVGQSFNRLRRDQREGRQPRVRLFLNQAADKGLGHGLVLRLVGDPSKGVNRDALGAIVRMTAVLDGHEVTQSRELVGIGGHQGKQMDFAIHFGLGDATEAQRIEIDWPSANDVHTVLEHISAGAHTISLAEQ